jgi:Flp pilus assembly protein TadG
MEVSLLAPWIFFVFMGVFDMGFYAVALISTQNAARAAALHTSSSASTASDLTGACQYARAEFQALSNARDLADCNSLPLLVTAAAITGVDGFPASRLTVTYRTPQLIPLPWLAGQMTVTRVVEMRIKE